MPSMADHFLTLCLVYELFACLGALYVECHLQSTVVDVSQHLRIVPQRIFSWLSYAYYTQ